MTETIIPQTSRQLAFDHAPDESLPIHRFPIYEDILARHGLRGATEPRDTLVVRSGAALHLTTRAGLQSTIAPHLQQLDNLDTFKAWIGVQDERFECGAVPMPTDLPSGPWTGGADFDVDGLSAQQRTDIGLAARCYLFGYSRLVATYRDAITRVYAPFTVAAYMIRHLTIEPGAELTVSGAPALLLFDQIDLYRGGRMVFHDPFSMCVRHLHKHDLS